MKLHWLLGESTDSLHTNLFWLSHVAPPAARLLNADRLLRHTTANLAEQRKNKADLNACVLRY
ncbi:unnamed protein product [Leuciscus chuanchicus]